MYYHNIILHNDPTTTKNSTRVCCVCGPGVLCDTVVVVVAPSTVHANSIPAETSHTHSYAPLRRFRRCNIAPPFVGCWTRTVHIIFAYMRAASHAYITHGYAFEHMYIPICREESAWPRSGVLRICVWAFFAIVLIVQRRRRDDDNDAEDRILYTWIEALAIRGLRGGGCAGAPTDVCNAYSVRSKPYICGVRHPARLGSMQKCACAQL